MIQIFESNIQSGIQIGTITEEIKAESCGDVKYYTISLSSGEVISTVKNSGATDHTWQLVKAKDNSSQTILSFIRDDEKDFIKFLLKQLYLYSHYLNEFSLSKHLK